MVTGGSQLFPGLFGAALQLHRGPAASCGSNPLLMKNDYSFKLVAAILFVGVIVALVSPSHALPRADGTPVETAPAAVHTE
jgi:hypothetical protein